MLGPLFDLIRRFEGLRLKPYLCPAGVPPVGYGHTGPEVKIGGPAISPGLAESLMADDAGRYATIAARLSPKLVAAGEGPWSAIADFNYNLGSARYKASTLRRKIDAGDWHGAREELDKWVWGGGRKLPGLILRRAAEGALLPR